MIEHQDLFLDSLNKYKVEFDFSLICWVILPDHFHIIFDPKNYDLSLIMQKIKISFSKKFRYLMGSTHGTVWQKRFWDHVIRNEDDLNKHIDYVHFNPVKHGYVNSPFEWRHSSIHDYIKQGYYSPDWGVLEMPNIVDDYGE